MADGIRIDVRLEGLEAAVRRVDGISNRVTDFSDAFHEIDGVVSEMFRRRFDTDGRSPGDDAPWTPLAPSTMNRRMTRSGGNRGGILWDFGDLRASLVKVGPESIRVIDPMRFERGTTRRGAFAHQEGRGVPKREIIPDPMPRSMTDQFEEILIAHAVRP